MIGTRLKCSNEFYENNCNGLKYELKWKSTCKKLSYNRQFVIYSLQCKYASVVQLVRKLVYKVVMTSGGESMGSTLCKS